ncbi:MAG TPA: trypsin-like peptidase domain-containing protein [Baekduia sp.]
MTAAMRARRRAVCALAVGAVAASALGGAVAGCGGSSKDDNSTATTTAGTGATVPSGSGSGSGSDEGDGGSGSAAAFDPQTIYQRDSPGVVTILSAFSGGGSSGDVSGDGDPSAALGSGFVISPSGEIATNAHVVTTGEGASIHKAREVFVRFADRNEVAAKIVGFDPFSDVALIKVDPSGLTLRPLTLGEVDDVEVGAPVAAIGSPFGEESSLSVGVISATDRSIQSLTGFQTSGALQTDAAINSGNSGGPLLDAQGRVLGINSQIRSSSGSGSGVGFAVPVDVVRRSLDQLRRSGKVEYPYLGVSTSGVYPQLAQHFHLGADHGAWVQTVVPNGPGDRAGLKAGTRRESFQEQEYRVGGDVITKVGDEDVVQDSDLARLLDDKAPGDEVTLTVVRGSDTLQVKVALGTRPLQSPQG